MHIAQRMMAVGALAGLGLLAGCSSSSHHDYDRTSRTYDPYSTTSAERRSYDPNGYDRYDARTAGSTHGPWRDEDGDLHHNRDWKADSDRGRDSNDRDDPSRRGY